MRWFTGDRPFLEPDAETWQLDAWRWLRRNRVGVGHTLVLPNRHFFPPTQAAGHARAEHVFACVKRHAGMDEWPCQLVAQEPSPELRVGELVALRRATPVAAGTYSAAGNAARITYDPAMVDTPVRLVATLAHELAHYRQDALPDPPPGGEGAIEPATDLCTVALGFGVFGASCAFNFHQFQDSGSQGWSTSSLGYLSEREWAFALAVWLELEGHAVREVRDVLKPSLYTDVNAARRSILKRKTMESLRSVRDEESTPC